MSEDKKPEGLEDSEDRPGSGPRPEPGPRPGPGDLSTLVEAMNRIEAAQAARRALGNMDILQDGVQQPIYRELERIKSDVETPAVDNRLDIETIPAPATILQKGMAQRMTPDEVLQNALDRMRSHLVAAAVGSGAEPGVAFRTGLMQSFDHACVMVWREIAAPIVEETRAFYDKELSSLIPDYFGGGCKVNQDELGDGRLHIRVGAALMHKVNAAEDFIRKSVIMSLEGATVPGIKQGFREIVQHLKAVHCSALRLGIARDMMGQSGPSLEIWHLLRDTLVEVSAFLLETGQLREDQLSALDRAPEIDLVKVPLNNGGNCRDVDVYTLGDLRKAD